MSSISAREFSAAVRRITPLQGWSPRIAVAVSGGPDSIALLHLLNRWIREDRQSSAEQRPHELFALTVDHRFRVESAQEADDVNAFARSIGVPHHTLRIPWSIPPFPPLPGGHRTESPGRLARLTLFQRFMEEERMGSLWMGHHRGDQGENKLLWGHGMRAVSRMPAGLEPPSPDTDRTIVRPLLGFDKSRLLATCETSHLPFFIDPTNFVPSHTPRNALRHSLALVQARHLAHPHLLSNEAGGPLALLHRTLQTDLLPRLPAAPSVSFSLDSPAKGSATLHPGRLPPRSHPDVARSLLRKLVAFVVGSEARISNHAIEEARRRIWESGGGEGRKAFTPGGGVVLRPVKTGWIVSKQKPRKERVEGDGEEVEGAQQRIE